ANLLAENLSTHLKSEAVITTSTDRNTVFSVDLWSVKNNCFTLEIAHIKDISSEILKGHSVGFYSDFPIVGDLPKELIMDQTASIGICVSENSSLAPFEKTLHLIPKRVVLGIGCRKGIEFRLLYPQIVSALQEHHLAMEQILLLASIDLKKEELALLQLAKKWRLPFQTYSASELNHVDGTFTASSFVESVTGVDNVCERAAWKAAISVPSDPYMAAGAFDVSAAHFIFRKITGDGVTISAVLRENWQCDFL
ncbi:MAG: cobalamin biosynthesis protein, partial [Oscillospiraceae bacterium]